MLSQTITQTVPQNIAPSVPEQWFADYAQGNYYAMLSLTDYIALRQAGDSLATHPISRG